MRLLKVYFQGREGIPYLAPGIVLLYKSNNIDENNQHDFEICVSVLSDEQKQWLKSGLEKLYGEHAWAGQL